MVVSIGDIATVMAYKLAHIGQAITNSRHITRIHFRVICSVCVHVLCLRARGECMHRDRGREWRGEEEEGEESGGGKREAILLTPYLLQ